MSSLWRGTFYQLFVASFLPGRADELDGVVDGCLIGKMVAECGFRLRKRTFFSAQASEGAS